MKSYLLTYHYWLKSITIILILLVFNSCCTKKECICTSIESFSISFYNNNNNVLKIEIIDKSNGQSILKETKNSYFYIGSYGSIIPKSIKDYTYIINYENIKDTIKEIKNTHKISSGVCNKCFFIFNSDRYECKIYENYSIKMSNKTVVGNEIIY